MAFEQDRVQTITVDSYGTLVDTDAAEKALAARVKDPRPISQLWRVRSLIYTMVGNYIEQYQPFYEINRAALQYALDVHGVDLSEEERNEILSVYHELDVFPDVRGGLRRLRNQGYPVYVLSNGNPEMLDSMVQHAEIHDVVEDKISVHEIQTFKPHPSVYRHAAERTDTPIQKIVHVAGPGFDVQGAMHSGMQGAWINRAGQPWEAFGPEPDLEIESFYDLADKLGS